MGNTKPSKKVAKKVTRKVAKKPTVKKYTTRQEGRDAIARGEF